MSRHACLCLLACLEHRRLGTVAIGEDMVEGKVEEKRHDDCDSLRYRDIQPQLMETEGDRRSHQYAADSSHMEAQAPKHPRPTVTGQVPKRYQVLWYEVDDDRDLSGQDKCNGIVHMAIYRQPDAFIDDGNES